MKTKRPSRLVIVDHLTGLYNRRYFDKRLKKSILEAKKKTKHFSLLMIDIDKFKDVNDKYGHLAGDKVLNDLAKILKQSVRRPDICFRYGADEIAVILPGSEKKAAAKIMACLKTKIEKHRFVIEGGIELRLRLSIGLAIFPDDGLKPRELIKQAYALLYKVKARKKPKRRITESFILETKLVLPSLKENTIARPRLLASLKKNLDKKLILITADAGYGKTTLLTQLIKDEKFPYVYYDLDRNDSDLSIFLKHLTHGLEKIQQGLAQRTTGLLSQGGEAVSNYELIAGTLINELVKKRKQELFLILDDYHNLYDKSMVHQALDYFIDHLPDVIHVIIASRIVPPFVSLAKWRSKQDLFELSREGLKFTEEGVKVLLNEVYKIALPDDELKQVSEQTEGWITGIQLILHSARKDGKAPTEAGIKETLNGYLAANQPLFDYFANEIYTMESDDIQDFLKKSSILDVMTTEMCNDVFEMKNSEKMLKDFERRNLFISSVGKNEYKYHHLFLTFLQKQLKDKEGKKKLHLKAADYYQRKGQFEQVIEHYLEAGTYKWAGKMIVQAAEEMAEKGRLATLSSWLKQMPDDVFEKQPQLITIRGILVREQGDLEEAEANFVRAERLLRVQGDAGGLTDTLKERGRSLYRRGKHSESLKALRQALRTCPQPTEKKKEEILNLMGLAWMGLEEPGKAKAYLLKAKRMAERIQSFHDLLTAEGNLGTLLLDMGEVRLAFDIYRPLIARIKENYHLGIGATFSNAAKVAIELGQIEWAEQSLKHGWDLCIAYEDSSSMAALHRSFGYLYLQKGEWDKALFHFEKALERYAALGRVWLEPILLLDLGRFYRYHSDFENAKRYLDSARQKAGDLRSLWGRISILTEFTLLYVTVGQFEKAEEAIKTCLRESRKSWWKKQEFYVLLARSAVHWWKKEQKEAFRRLSQAVRLAKIKGYDGILARELRHSSRLAELAQRLISVSSKMTFAPDYLREILKKCGLPRGSDGCQPRLEVQLFGKFELFVGGVPKTSQLKRQTTKAIFAFFLLHSNKETTWEEITSWVWPESSPSSAHQMFRNALCEIRKSVSVVKSDMPYHTKCYRLNTEIPLKVDALEFQKFIKQASETTEESKRIDFLEKAVELYKNLLLPGMHYPWVDSLRSIFENQHINAFTFLAEIYAMRKDYEKSIFYCLKFLEIDELNEKIHRLLIANYIHLGHKSWAIKHYEHLRKILYKNFNTEPSIETTSLIESLR